MYTGCHSVVEQATDGEVDFRSDQFSSDHLYEMVTGSAREKAIRRYGNNGRNPSR